MVDERSILRKRARIVIAIGVTLCLAAAAAVIAARALGLIGNVYANIGNSFGGGYLWVETHGAAWVVGAAVLLIVGVAVTAAGIAAHRRERRTARVPAARIVTVTARWRYSSFVPATGQASRRVAASVPDGA